MPITIFIETKRINEAVKNNPDRFPTGYIIEVSETEKIELVENFDRFNRLKHSTAMPCPRLLQRKAPARSKRFCALDFIP